MKTADLQGLIDRYRVLAPDSLKLALSGNRILIVTHLDADGLASGSIMLSSLTRKGANAVLRTVPDLDSKTIHQLQSQRYDFYIFTDLASTLIAELGAAFDGRYLVIDHHQLPDEDMRNPAVVNSWA
ncbi:MAG TPA: DHH family phosphoesterase, partial [Nitrososphaerales archaeon]|nr:DHH family phosphoesterase [Nitrososphaerales archaeon]